ncbi:hypothetical protein PPERSA_08291 [Pseudocohnilembus persalinus]|uniref:Uncharacterized protein n=1 Tax=Pseudocohnilembus persalinus TaxID=266149 RepID=A0A0V0QPG1_PSEPJ|nr:hypothetical protein PPERSA_08291 [Pseudocohnilembus persalinus]|eukprot:KRX04076.1 hypothetical protein PPERSA_08291 [Pseudocohnilembus persalinus]
MFMLPVTRTLNKYIDKKRRFEYIKVVNMLNANNPDFEPPQLHSESSEIEKHGQYDKEEQFLKDITISTNPERARKQGNNINININNNINNNQINNNINNNDINQINKNQKLNESQVNTTLLELNNKLGQIIGQKGNQSGLDINFSTYESNSKQKNQQYQNYNFESKFGSQKQYYRNKNQMNLSHFLNFLNQKQLDLSQGSSIRSLQEKSFQFIENNSLSQFRVKNSSQKQNLEGQNSKLDFKKKRNSVNNYLNQQIQNYNLNKMQDLENIQIGFNQQEQRKEHHEGEQIKDFQHGQEFQENQDFKQQLKGEQIQKQAQKQKQIQIQHGSDFIGDNQVQYLKDIGRISQDLVNFESESQNCYQSSNQSQNQNQNQNQNIEINKFYQQIVSGNSKSTLNKMDQKNEEEQEFYQQQQFNRQKLEKSPDGSTLKLSRNNLYSNNNNTQKQQLQKQISQNNLKLIQNQQQNRSQSNINKKNKGQQSSSSIKKYGKKSREGTLIQNNSNQNQNSNSNYNQSIGNIINLSQNLQQQQQNQQVNSIEIIKSIISKSKNHSNSNSNLRNSSTTQTKSSASNKKSISSKKNGIYSNNVGIQLQQQQNNQNNSNFSRKQSQKQLLGNNISNSIGEDQKQIQQQSQSQQISARDKGEKSLHIKKGLQNQQNSYKFDNIIDIKNVYNNISQKILSQENNLNGKKAEISKKSSKKQISKTRQNSFGNGNSNNLLNMQYLDQNGNLSYKPQHQRAKTERALLNENSQDERSSSNQLRKNNNNKENQVCDQAVKYQQNGQIFNQTERLYGHFRQSSEDKGLVKKGIQQLLQQQKKSVKKLSQQQQQLQQNLNNNNNNSKQVLSVNKSNNIQQQGSVQIQNPSYKQNLQNLKKAQSVNSRQQQHSQMQSQRSLNKSPNLVQNYRNNNYFSQEVSPSQRLVYNNFSKNINKNNLNQRQMQQQQQEQQYQQQDYDSYLNSLANMLKSCNNQKIQGKSSQQNLYISNKRKAQKKSVGVGNLTTNNNISKNLQSVGYKSDFNNYTNINYNNKNVINSSMVKKSKLSVHKSSESKLQKESTNFKVFQNNLQSIIDQQQQNRNQSSQKAQNLDSYQKQQPQQQQQQQNGQISKSSSKKNSIYFGKKLSQQQICENLSRGSSSQHFQSNMNLSNNQSNNQSIKQKKSNMDQTEYQQLIKQYKSLQQKQYQQKELKLLQEIKSKTQQTSNINTKFNSKRNSQPCNQQSLYQQYNIHSSVNNNNNNINNNNNSNIVSKNNISSLGTEQKTNKQQFTLNLNKLKIQQQQQQQHLNNNFQQQQFIEENEEYEQSGNEGQQQQISQNFQDFTYQKGNQINQNGKVHAFTQRNLNEQFSDVQIDYSQFKEQFLNNQLKNNTLQQQQKIKTNMNSNNSNSNNLSSRLSKNARDDQDFFSKIQNEVNNLQMQQQFQQTYR